jgi:heptosyltransferase III
MSILFITSTRIGDAILSTGVLDWAIRQYPADAVTVACGVPAAPIFRSVPNLKQLIRMRKQKGSGHWVKLWRQVATTRWRVVIDLRRSLMPWLILAEQRYRASRSRPGVHRVQSNAAVVGSGPLAPCLWLSSTDRVQAEMLLAQRSPIIACAPVANWRGKIWPAERFAELLQRLTAPGAPYGGYSVFVSTGPGEEETARPLLDRLPPTQVITGLGLSLGATAAVFARARLFVGNDSGLMHLAAAAGAPTVGLFGPTRDEFYAPWGKRSLVVRTPESADELLHRAREGSLNGATLMASLTVDRVEAMILQHNCLREHEVKVKNHLQSHRQSHR